MPKPLIALLTDFGMGDAYVGIMKGVILNYCPEARLVDITHGVLPQNIRQASYLLYSSYRYFPVHTVFLVVVDPSVGTDRLPVAIQTDHGVYVGPDNGVFSSVLREADSWQAVRLWTPENLSATFHGRDLFAPAAAALACGAALNEIGSPTVDLVQLPHLHVDRVAQDTLEGEVIHVDHFGNIITSLGAFTWHDEFQALRLEWTPPVEFDPSTAYITIADHHITSILPSYAHVPPGELLALISSDGQLEIAANQANAAQFLKVEPGKPVRLTFTLNTERQEG
jgi:S-adenosylmethionine hydrolase